MRRGKRRPVAGREEILAAARAIGQREGWRAVTIRSVAQALGYASPLLYEHFRDKEDLLTQIAVEAIALLERKLTEDLPEDSDAALPAMAERYWQFMLEHTQLYRLMNGMDGAPLDKDAVSLSAQSLCGRIAGAVRPYAAGAGSQKLAEELAAELADELWALMHGMATLYLDRSAPFNQAKATRAAIKLIRNSVA